MRPALVALMFVFTWLAAASNGRAQPAAPAFDPAQAPAVFSRLAPSIVQVNRGDRWGTGFLVTSSRLVVTSYSVVDAAGALEVLVSDGTVHGARVVAWSEAEDLVILELDAALPARPLAVGMAAPSAAQPIAVLYSPHDDDRDKPTERGWSPPIAYFGRVGRASKSGIDLDVYVYGRPGDSGAPVVTPEGEVIGIVSFRSTVKARLVATPALRAVELAGRAGTQGEFSRTFRTRAFASFFFSPDDADGLYGAGIGGGVAYRWVAIEFTDGFFRSDRRPTALGRFESVARFQFEADAELQLDLGRWGFLYAGPGAQLDFDSTKVIRVAPDPSPGTQDDFRLRVKPSGVLGWVDWPFLVRAVVSRETRFDIGLTFGGR